MARFLHRRAFLRPPVWVTPAVTVTFPGPRVTLAGRSRLERLRRRSHSNLRGPVLVTPLVPEAEETFAGPQTTFAAPTYPRSSRVQSRLGRPIRVFAPPFTPAPIRVTLAGRTRIDAQRRRSYSFLRGPVVVTSVEEEAPFFGPQVNLIRIRPPHRRAQLRPPAFISAAEVVPVPAGYEQTPSVRLQRIRPPAVHSRLRLPAVLEAPAQVYFGPSVQLQRIRPSAVRSRIRPPAVVRIPSVELERQTIRTQLARIRPPQRFSRLRRPTALRVFSGPETSLIRIRPAQVRSELRPPTVITPAAEPNRDQQTITVLLRRIRPPKIKSVLRGPATLRRRGPDQISTTLAAHARRRGKGVLRPPTKVRIPAVELEQRTLRTQLIRIRPRPIESVLRPPRVITAFFAKPIETVLARIRPAKVQSVLRPPATLEVRPPVETKLKISLVRIQPPPTVHFLRPLVEGEAFIPDEGDVCGSELPPSQVICGTSSSGGSRISGTVRSRSRASGTDQEAN